MPSLETYRKQAKLLLRWHRDANYAIGERLRALPRFCQITDREALAMPLTLTLAPEIVAVEAGFENWAALKLGAGGPSPTAKAEEGATRLIGAIPILFVRDVTAAAAYYENKAGFRLDFLHGKPPFYGAVSRDGVTLHLRHVHATNFSGLAMREKSLILATIEVLNVKALFEEFSASGVDFAQRLVKQAWGGTDLHVRDPDGNVISFVQYRVAPVG